MGVNVVNRAVYGGHRLLHAAHRALARRCNHVVAITGRTVTDDFGIDVGAPRQSMLQRLQHYHAATAGDDEPIAIDIVGT